MRGSSNIRAAVSLLTIAWLGACRLPGSTAVDTTAVYGPSWISASWDSAGGPPSFRFNRDAVFHGDPICPAYAIGLRLSPDFDTLIVSSNCAVATRLYICATNGYPAGGMGGCSADVPETPASAMTIAALDSGARWAGPPGTPGLSLEVFYCGSRSSLAFAPLRCAP